LDNTTLLLQFPSV